MATGPRLPSSLLQPKWKLVLSRAGHWPHRPFTIDSLLLQAELLRAAKEGTLHFPFSSLSVSTSCSEGSNELFTLPRFVGIKAPGTNETRAYLPAASRTHPAHTLAF